MDRLGARRYWWIWAAVVPIAFWALIRTFGLDEGSLLGPPMVFTPYVAIAALLVSGVAMALRNWAAAAVVGTATACLAVAVLPRAIGGETTQAAGHRTLSVVSANVYFGEADPTDLLALVDRVDADLLSVQELTPSFAGKLRRLGIERRLPYSVLMPRARGRGGGLYARAPLTLLPHPAGPPFHMPWAAMTLPGDGRLHVAAVHTQPPTMSLGNWQAGLESLPATGAGAPWVLAGDFNATLDEAELRDVVDDGYRDAGDETGRGLEPTWPNDRTLPPLVTVDHILADERLGIVDYAVEDLPGSDHRAVFARLALP